MATENEIMSAIRYLTGAYSNYRPPDMKSTLEIYIKHLKPFPIDIIQKAFARCIETSTFFPTIAEIEKAIHEEAVLTKNTCDPENYFKKKPIGEDQIEKNNAFRAHMVEKGLFKPIRKKIVI